VQKRGAEVPANGVGVKLSVDKPDTSGTRKTSCSSADLLANDSYCMFTRFRCTLFPMPKCKPFTVALALLMPDNKRQISLVVDRGCVNDSPVYLIIFVLRDLVDGDFQDRVKLQVTLGDVDKAQGLMDSGLKASQLDFLTGPVTNKAKKLAAGTTKDPATEKKIADIVNQ